MGAARGPTKGLKIFILIWLVITWGYKHLKTLLSCTLKILVLCLLQTVSLMVAFY